MSRDPTQPATPNHVWRWSYERQHHRPWPSLMGEWSCKPPADSPVHCRELDIVDEQHKQQRLQL